MKLNIKLSTIAWWLLDAVAIVAGLIILIGIVLSAPSFIGMFISEASSTYINLGDVIGVIVFTVVFLGLIILSYSIQYKIQDWWDKRKEKCYICKGRRKGQLAYKGYDKYYHFECAENTEESKGTSRMNLHA